MRPKLRHALSELLRSNGWATIDELADAHQVIKNLLGTQNHHHAVQHIEKMGEKCFIRKVIIHDGRWYPLWIAAVDVGTKLVERQHPSERAGDLLGFVRMREPPEEEIEHMNEVVLMAISIAKERRHLEWDRDENLD